MPATSPANVGLRGGFGTLQVGRNTAPFFLATIFHNPLVDSFTVGPSITHVFRGNLQGDTGMSNSVRYTSPTFGGARADVLYSVGTETTVAADRNNSEAIDAALFYGGGPFSAALAYRSIDLNTGNDGHDQKSFLIGASYDLKFAKLQAQYVNGKDTWNALPDTERKTWQLGAAVPVGAGSIVASYATTDLDDTSPVTSNERKTWALGYIHGFSKRTDAYVVWYQDRFREPVGNKQEMAVVGIRHRF